MATDGFLRAVPSDTDPDDGRLYDPAVADGAGSLEATVAGDQTAQAGAITAELELHATTAAAQAGQAGALAGVLALTGEVAGSQLAQAGGSATELESEATSAGAQAVQAGGAEAVLAMAAASGAAQSAQGGSVEAGQPPQPIEATVGTGQLPQAGLAVGSQPAEEPGPVTPPRSYGSSYSPPARVRRRATVAGAQDAQHGTATAALRLTAVAASGQAAQGGEILADTIDRADEEATQFALLIAIE